MANKRSINRVILVGSVGRDPEITHVPSLSKDVAKFSMATTEVFMDKATNEFKDQTEWHNIVAWGWTAKKVEKNVHKGTLVLVEGKIKTRKYKDKNDQERYFTEIAADTVVPLERSGQGQGGYQQGGGYGGQQQGGYGGGQQQGGGYGGGQQGGFQGQQQQQQGGGYPGGDPYTQQQAPPAPPPEMQINDMQYDESDDPF